MKLLFLRGKKKLNSVNSILFRDILVKTYYEKPREMAFSDSSLTFDEGHITVNSVLFLELNKAPSLSVVHSCTPAYLFRAAEEHLFP